MSAVKAYFEVNNLVAIDKNVAEFSNKFYEKRKNLFRQKWVSACAVADYNMLNSPTTRKTVKKMITDGRIAPNEAYRNEKNIQMVLVEAIHRINKL